MSLSKNSHKEDQLEEKVLVVNRCSKVVKGGRKFSFSALILVGDGKGRLGYGFAKANELTDAIRKGGEAAKKNLMKIEALEDGSIPHEVLVHHDGAQLLLKPAKPGTGIVAGSRIRLILEMAGIKDIVAKSFGSNNPMNQVKAAFKALTGLSPRKDLLRRGAAIND
ncbi:ribosomal protein S5 [Chlamydia pneumoniae TW-183]|uniref:Small ribosomal subunit protein uS5 n=2 Tax=Chlamydia pneumoniae TaxID=83558 RepID=RS5_CHLPN|nr:30S ribosomal protein S5 [Chlamydia pneumoniae]Q9Z7S3.1 RecName: Full=Small ribosomal subunit protein uS5; AltName: Full=30S ribosomal protein S5 [Chlamydia pneumoniae]AAD18770.1 S5 Ribosomal Protein [Chlamydia pneumoniae CWL029]AAF37999.1 ribosomal protein S5 [Chlamydia pneumoniae AR39]AAP98586.1 ribosomal protein S5 [Chlamydia pneumoniae TW-183]CRI33148.1 30S ribosomal protein S5 [Chlamydia pneumoniae]CRI36011.1 30S ribosomal protein S5 [Chlamydia pneumoniae]